MRHAHTFVVRILMDDDGTQTVRGQVTQPSSTDEWRASFVGAMDLWRALMERLQAAVEVTLVEQSERNERQ